MTDPSHKPLYDELTAFFRAIDIGSPSGGYHDSLTRAAGGGRPYDTSSSSQIPKPRPEISVLAGVSGGADSVALIHLLHEDREALGIGRIAIAHVNHGLRGEESDGDEAFVRGIAERLGIDIFVTKLDGSLADDDGDGIENWARNERYRFFQKIKNDNEFTHIATAHTANDQAETVIMRLTRGTGVRGLRGILDRRHDGVIRPLLGAERRQLERYLDDRGLTYRTDSSNADTRFRRNFVRAEIIPLLTEHNSQATSNIAACAASAARVWEIVAGQINKWINEYVIRVNDTVFHIEKAGFADDGLTAAEALVTLFDEYGISISRLHVNRVMSSIRLSSGKHLLPDGWRFYPTDDRICFVRE